MKRLKMLAALALSGVTIFALYGCETSKESATRKAVEAQMKETFGADAKPDSITKTPYGGLYEVRFDGDVFYTDKDAKYMFFGNVIDAKTRRNYTAERREEINRIQFSSLPLDLAAKMVKGDGKRKIAVFEDPNCGYCKHFRHTLQDVDNITVYTFMYNILAPDSADKSRRIWCAPDRAKAWDEWMVSGKLPPEPAADCKEPNQEVFALGQKLRITGTPTIFFTDGSRIPGAVDKAALESKLASVK